MVAHCLRAVAASLLACLCAAHLFDFHPEALIMVHCHSSALKTMAGSLALHAKNDLVTGSKHHSARMAALAAFKCGAIDGQDLRRASALHRAANRAKHSPASLSVDPLFYDDPWADAAAGARAPLTAAPSPPSSGAPPASADAPCKRLSWADLSDDFPPSVPVPLQKSDNGAGILAFLYDDYGDDVLLLDAPVLRTDVSLPSDSRAVSTQTENMPVMKSDLDPMASEFVPMPSPPLCGAPPPVYDFYDPTALLLDSLGTVSTREPLDLEQLEPFLAPLRHQIHILECDLKEALHAISALAASLGDSVSAAIERRCPDIFNAIAGPSLETFAVSLKEDITHLTQTQCDRVIGAFKDFLESASYFEELLSIGDKLAVGSALQELLMGLDSSGASLSFDDFLSRSSSDSASSPTRTPSLPSSSRSRRSCMASSLEAATRT